jgi:hypothetical protein
MMSTGLCVSNISSYPDLSAHDFSWYERKKKYSTRDNAARLNRKAAQAEKKAVALACLDLEQKNAKALQHANTHRYLDDSSPKKRRRIRKKSVKPNLPKLNLPKLDLEEEKAAETIEYREELEELEKVINSLYVASAAAPAVVETVEATAETTAETQAEVAAETQAEVAAETQAEVAAETQAEVAAETTADAEYEIVEAVEKNNSYCVIS